MAHFYGFEATLIYSDGGYSPGGPVAPPAPTLVEGIATGGTLATITITDASAGTAAHRIQIRTVGSSTWVDAVGATNPMPAGVLVFTATGLTPALQYEAQAQAERSALNSAYVAAAAWWQDVVVGGGGELPGGTAPAITVQPANQSALVGATATFSFTATGTAPLTYQWRRNGVNIGGATAASYTTPALVIGDNGASFTVVVSGPVAPPATSSAALLTVTAANTIPAVVTQPTAQSVVEGATATFTTAFTGTPTPTLQWYRNGVAISGATSASYSLTTALSDNGAAFYCRGTNVAGATNTNAVSLTVAAASGPPSFILQPASQAVIAGQAATFTVAVAGTTPISVQWRRGGVAISGATGLSYAFTAQIGDNGAVIDAVATNVVSSVPSSAATLTVTAAPVVALINFELALGRILPYANGCPDVTAVFHLRQSAIEFFQRALAWQQWLADIASVSGDDAYSMPLPAQSAVVKLLKYQFNGAEENLTDATMGDSLSVNGSCVDAGWTNDRVIFSITPTPAESGKIIRLRVALKPTQAATGIPAAHWEQYIHYIAYGALASVLDIPSQNFTNPQQAAVWRGKFEEAIARVGAATSRGFSRTQQRVRGHFF